MYVCTYLESYCCLLGDATCIHSNDLLTGVDGDCTLLVDVDGDCTLLVDVDGDCTLLVDVDGGCTLLVDVDGGVDGVQTVPATAKK